MTASSSPPGGEGSDGPVAPALPPDAAAPPIGPTLSWLDAEADRLLDGARAARADEGGFWWLDAEGHPDRGRPRQLWISARMTHCYALGAASGRSRRGRDELLVDHGIAALLGGFEDRDYGGWFAGLGPTGRPVSGVKAAYDQVFVLLAASGAVVLGRPRSAELLERATEVLLARFWDDEAGALVEEWNRDWTVCDPYRGANANMHAVEAFLAAADASGDPAWRDRALRIGERLVNREARRFDWRVPEHFDARWEVRPEYNADQPDHPFRPYGITPGHGLEWARLLLHLRAHLIRDGRSAPIWLLEAAVGLFDRAVDDGWDDVRPGLPYTTDWQGNPVVNQRFHWVICEGIAAAAALWRATGEVRYATWYDRFWGQARETFLDGRPGWVHETDPDGRPATRTWTGRPDIYHALQATVVARLPLAPSFVAAALSGPGH